MKNYTGTCRIACTKQLYPVVIITDCFDFVYFAAVIASDSVGWATGSSSSL